MASVTRRKPRLKMKPRRSLNCIGGLAPSKNRVLYWLTVGSFSLIRLLYLLIMFPANTNLSKALEECVAEIIRSSIEEAYGPDSVVRCKMCRYDIARCWTNYLIEQSNQRSPADINYTIDDVHAVAHHFRTTHPQFWSEIIALFTC